MKTNMKQKFLRTIVGGALIAVLLPVSSAFAVSTFPTSGSCAMLVTQPVPIGKTIPAMNVGYNMLAVLNFTSATGGTIAVNQTRVDYTTNDINVNTTGSGGISGTFTIGSLTAPAPAEGRSITITVTAPAVSAGTVVANAIAVNGGSTLLIQGASDPFSGVCQF